MRHSLHDRSLTSGLERSCRGGATLEFAVVALPFLFFLMFLIEIGYDFFAQVALDYGVQTAARQIQTGQAQNVKTASIFMTTYLCPVLTGLLPCSSIKVNVAPVTTDFYTAAPTRLPTNATGQLDTSRFTYCPGSPNQLMMLRAIYTPPSLVSAIVPSMATSTTNGIAHVTSSSIAFANENFPVVTGPPAGC